MQAGRRRTRSYAPWLRSGSSTTSPPWHGTSANEARRAVLAAAAEGTIPLADARTMSSYLLLHEHHLAPPLAPRLADALALLAGQHWRGNTRELRNVLEQLAMRSDSQRVDAAEVARVLAETGVESIAAPEPLAAPAQGEGDDAAALLLRPLAEQVAELERRAIAATLAATGGNKLAAARRLGISRATLYDRMGEDRG